MSGGHFDYAQYRIDDITDSIEREIEAARKPKPPKVWKEDIAVYLYEGSSSRYFCCRDLTYAEAMRKYQSDGYKVAKETTAPDGLKTALIQNRVGDAFEIRQYRWQQYADGKDYPEWAEATLREFEAAVRCLRRAAVYAQRIDWLLSGDDGEEEFHERLEKELEELDKKQNDQ